LKPPWFTKLAALAAVVLLLLFGLGLIEDVVRGRRRYRGLTARARDRRALSAESLFSLALFAVLALVMVLTRR
jgi:inner membrane protein